MSGWVMVKSDAHRNPKVVSLPSDSARWAWLVTIAEGKAVAGVWANEKHYQACVGRYARHLAVLVAAGLVDMEGETVVIHDWSDYQREAKDDPTNAERQRRFRERQRSKDNDGSEAVTEDRYPVSPHAVTEDRYPLSPHASASAVSLSMSLSTLPPREEEPYQVVPGPDAVAAYHRLTASFPSGKVLAWLNDLSRDFGDEAVESALTTETAADPERRTLLSRTQDRLRLADHEATKRREASDRQAAAAERMSQEAMTPDRRKANMDRLGAMMRASGLLPDVGR